MIWWCFCVCFFLSTLCLQVGICLGFEVVSAVLFLSFGVSCLRDWLEQPFFVCHQHLWFGLSFFATGICVRSISFMAFSAVSIRVRLFIFALLALVSGYQCISVVGIMLCACCSSASSLEIRTGIVSKSLTLWTALQIPLWSKPHLVFRHKVYEIALSEVLATQTIVTEAQHQSQLVWIVQIWHFRLTAGWFRENSCIVMLWAACELLQFAAIQ